MAETAEYPDVQKANHKTKFEDWLFKKYGNTDDKHTSYVMDKAEYDHTRDILTGVKRLEAADKRFQFKNKNYSLIDGKVARTITYRTLKVTETKKLVFLEEFFDILYDAHCIKRMHSGITKTFEYLNTQYWGIPKAVVSVAEFRQHCYICDLNKKQISQPRLNPIKSNCIFERVKIDLIN